MYSSFAPFGKQTHHTRDVSNNYDERKKNHLNTSNIHIAVLPFKVYSSQDSFDYLGDGFSENIIDRLSTEGQLRISSSTSSFRFKNSTSSLKEISELLNVHAIIEGSIIILDKNIRVFARLINPLNNQILWSQYWEGELESIITLQDKLSNEITERLRENFWHFDISGNLNHAKHISINAFLPYLEGQYLYKKWNETDVNSAISYFEKAIEQNKNYVDPYIGLAKCFVFLEGTGYLNPTETFEKVNNYFTKAKALKPNSIELEFVMAEKSFWKDWQLKKTFETLNKIIETNPSHSEAHTVLSLIYKLAGKSVQANKHINIALQLDPFSPNKLFTKGWIAYLNKDYTTAIKYCDQALKYTPNLMPAIVIKCCAQLIDGNAENTLLFIKNTPFVATDKASYYGLLGLCCVKLKKHEELERYKQQLNQLSTDRSLAFQFLINAALGDVKNALIWLNHAFNTKNSLLLFLMVDPLILPIIQNSNFKNLKARLMKIRWDKLENNKLSRSDCKKSWSQKDIEFIQNYMNSEHPYLDSEITIRKIADRVEIHHNKLSALINEEFGKNFSEFINGYRIDLFKKRIKDNNFSHLSLLGLAYECGFNSKSSFNTAFKRFTGMTPKTYKKSISQNKTSS